MRETIRRAVRGGWLPIAAMLLLLPGPALAADPLPATSADGGAATVLVVLLLGSLTAGLFFASPLRRRFARGQFTSTGVAPGQLSVGKAPGAQMLNRLADDIHARLAALTSRWPALQTATPLPPMLGGDIFFDDDAVPAMAPATPAPSSAQVGPWSTGPVSADRYGPFR